MRIKEYHNLIIKKHPYAESLNKKLLKDAEGLLKTHPHLEYTNINGERTSNIYDISSNVQILVKWILDEYRYNCNTWSIDDTHIKKRVGCWFAKYNKGDSTQRHHHRPHTWSWVYFVNCPRGSSPLVFSASGKRIKAEEGKVVIFDEQILNEVPKNRWDYRKVFAGNVICWTESFSDLDSQKNPL